MQEIEVKILEINVPEIVGKLRQLGAKKTFDGEMISTMYDFADKTLSKQNSILRLRREGERTQLTYKKLIHSKTAKVAEELEISVSDFDLTEKLLRGLGLFPKRGYPLTKHRVTYTLDHVHFEFDTFPQFPTYMEIEAPSIAVIKKYAHRLGLSIDQLKPWATRDVFAYYRKQGLLKD